LSSLRARSSHNRHQRYPICIEILSRTFKDRVCVWRDHWASERSADFGPQEGWLATRL
jgi:hypothetical protein